MSNVDVQSLARELLSAYEAGQMVAVPPSSRDGDFDLTQAYAVEAEVTKLREAQGHKCVGVKVGYANKAVWRILKLETLVWGHMYEDTVHYAGDNSAALAIPHARSLKVEPEVVFGLKEPITAELSEGAAALAAVDWYALGFEIIDCPFPDWKFQPSDFVASLGLHAALVVGQPQKVVAEEIPALFEALARFKVRMSKNGEFVEEGSGRNSLRNPALCLAELGSAILRRGAPALEAGELISSGTLTAGHPTVKGDLWRADIDGLTLPSLTLKIE
jgi:2-keto-4-pentenoate hydratase